jgi:hypothetical protein
VELIFAQAKCAICKFRDALQKARQAVRSTLTAELLARAN